MEGKKLADTRSFWRLGISGESINMSILENRIEKGRTKKFERVPAIFFWWFLLIEKITGRRSRFFGNWKLCRKAIEIFWQLKEKVQVNRWFLLIKIRNIQERGRCFLSIEKFTEYMRWRFFVTQTKNTQIRTVEPLNYVSLTYGRNFWSLQ